MELYRTSELVFVILKYYPETRDDDYLLWLKVIEWDAVLNHDDCILKEMTARNFLAQIKRSGLPLFETVSRARRLVQAKYPELKGTRRTQMKRAEFEEIYREFFKKN